MSSSNIYKYLQMQKVVSGVINVQKPKFFQAFKLILVTSLDMEKLFLNRPKSVVENPRPR